MSQLSIVPTLNLKSEREFRFKKVRILLSGKPKDLIVKYGLTSENIVEKAKLLFNRKG